MNKTINFISICLVTLSYALIIGLLLASFLNVLSLSVGISLDGKGVIETFPIFYRFCIIIGILSFVALIVAIFLNIWFADRFKYNRIKLYTQIIGSLVFSIPMMAFWMKAIEILHNLF